MRASSTQRHARVRITLNLRDTPCRAAPARLPLEPSRPAPLPSRRRRPTPAYNADPEPIKREVKSGLLALIQQCICAIELIGTRLLGRDDEVQALRVVRDQLLGTTPAGREWTLLFERVQAPLTGIVLADERLARQTAAVVAAAGQLAASEEAILGRDEAGQAAALLDELEGRGAEPGLRRDLRLVRAQLERGEGRPISEMLRTLMAQGPEASYGTASP